MKFFVTGASGELGGALVKRLIQDGHEVVAYLRHSSSDRRLKDLPVTIGRGALLDPFGLKKWMKGCDGVFHVAGLISWARKDRDKLLRTNVEGTRCVVQTAKDVKIPRVVMTSSVMGIGLPNRPEPIDERFVFTDTNTACDYPESKHRGQELARALAEPGFDVICVNPGVIIGPDSRMARVFRESREPRPLSYYFSGGINAVGLDDVVSGHLRAFEKGRSAETYILGGEVLSYQALFAQMAAHFGKAAPTRKIPDVLLKSIAAASEALAPLVGRSHLRIPYTLAKILCGTHYYNSYKAETELAWTWKPLRTVLQETF